MSSNSASRFYTILGISPNASEDIIRRAYKKRALEWDPNKDLNNPDYVNLFKTLQKAYETLSNEESKRKYDINGNNDDNETVPDANRSKLPLENYLSNIYKDKVKKWIEEYPLVKFVDNYEEKLSSIITSNLKTHKAEMKDPVEQCSVCHEFVCNKFEHMQLKSQDYLSYLAMHANNFNTELSKISSRGWNWEPIAEAPVIYRQLWESLEWTNLPLIVTKMVSVHKIFAGTNGTDRMFYEILQDVDPHIEQCAANLASSKVLTILPDVTSLKNLIDSENRTYLSRDEIPTNLKSNKDEEYREHGKVCVIRNKNHPILKHLFYDVSSRLPSYTTDKTNSKCSNCLTKLYSFNKKGHCRMCSKLTCQKCLLWQTCRHIGYIMPILICKSCTEKKITAVVDAIRHHIQQQIDLKRYEHLAEYLALLIAYKFNGNDFYESVVQHLLSNQQFTLALQYADYIHQSENGWFSLAKILVHMGAYNEAATCFDMIARQFERCAQYWISLGDTYRRETVKSSTDLSSTKLAVLAYRQAGLSYDGILEKALSESDANVRRLLVRYISHIHQQTLDEWREEGQSQLFKLHGCSIGICCLHLARLSITKWRAILQALVDISEYSTAAALLNTLSLEMIQHIMINSDIVLRFFCEEASNSESPMTDRLRSVVDSEHIDKILVIAALVHLQNKDYVWNILTEDYLSEPKQYGKVLICHKIRVELNLADSLDWIDQGVSENNLIAFDLKDSTSCDWFDIGNKHLGMKNYDTALNCFFKASRRSRSARTTVCEHILSLIHNLPNDIALWYAVVVCKKGQDIFPVICNSIQYISQILDVTQHSNKRFFISALDHMNKFEHPMCSSLFAMNLYFLSGFSTISKEFAGGLHFLETASTVNNQFATFQQQYDDYMYTRDYNKVQRTMNESIIKLALCLKQITSVNALKTFKKEYCGNLSIDHFPSIIQSKLYLIDAMIGKLENKYHKCIQKLHQVLAYNSDKDTIVAIVMLVKDQLTLKMGVQSILSDLANLSNMNLTRMTSLVIPIASPPKTFKFKNRLKPSQSLTLIYQHEKAITKEQGMDSFGAVMAYIDLCMTVSDRTCIVSNWILACLYLYEDLWKMTAQYENQSKAYAYRNLINELATNAFVLARDFLAPNMQMYIYKLVLPLIIHTNRLFSQMMKSKTVHDSETKIELTFPSRQNLIINQVLKYILDFAKLVPILPVQISLTYDVLFIERIGFDFLQVYLKTMVQDKYNNQMHFYRYYLFEGVWDGWLNHIDFELARQHSMKSLLANKHWHVFDVERLLNDLLIPRTLEGWLYHEIKHLGLLGEKHYAKVDGIKFNFNTGEVTFLLVPAREPGLPALFDSDDIVDIFTKDITHAIITLDQPDQEFLSHPFQEMKYAPASLANTKYLTTLLHADYLLKFMTTGMEINSKWPFPMRSTNEGFMQRLPKHLQDLLKPLEMRNKIFSHGYIHRFWIEAGNPVYEWEVDKKTNEIIYRISDVPMFVKQHLMKYDDKGRLIDDNRFDDKPDYSREAQFVKDFTDSYDEIGAYFPEFLRLKELAKLGILLYFIRHRYESLKIAFAEDMDVKTVCEILSKMRSTIDYPSNTYHNVKYFNGKFLQDNNIPSYDISYEEENENQKEICPSLKKDDDKIVETIAKTVCDFCCLTQKSHLKSLIDCWLRNSNDITPALWFCKKDASRELVFYIYTAMTEHKQLLINAIENLNISLEADDCSILNNDNQTCSWVPAVFTNKSIGQSRVYGGVRLSPKIERGYVEPDPQAHSVSVVNELTRNSRRKPSNGPLNLPDPYTFHNRPTCNKGNISSKSRYSDPGDDSSDIDQRSDDTYEYDADSDDDNENTCIYSDYNGNREQENLDGNFKESETEDQQRWIIIFLQSTSIGNNFLSSETEDADPNTKDVDIHTFDNAVDCLEYLSSVNNRYVMVVVADEYANDKQILMKLQESLPVSAIYRKLGAQDQISQYTDKELKDMCPKLQGSFTNTNRFPYTFLNVSNHGFNVFNPANTQSSTRSLNEESVTFLWYQIMIDLILSSVSTPEAKTDFFNKCRQLSTTHSYRLAAINKLQNTYQTRDVVTYYVGQAWFYLIINEALRFQNVSTIYHLRMAIIDLNKQLITMRTEDTSMVTLYRGQKIAYNEIQKLHRNINGLLAFNSFLSTSKDKKVAETFAGIDVDGSLDNSDDEKSMIFELKVSRNSFSDITTYNPNEKECLFMIGTTFKIVSVEKLRLGRKDYWKIQLISPNEGDLDELKRIKRQFQEKIIINNTPFKLQWGRFLYYIGEYDLAAEHYKKWLETFEDIDNNELLATIHNDLGLIYFGKEDYILSNKHHSLAFAQAQTAPSPIKLSVFYENQGATQMELENYFRALALYQHALDIERRQKRKNELNIGRLYSNMGTAHYRLDEFPMALVYFQAAFELQRRMPLRHATDLAATCNNLGDIFTTMNDYTEAEKYYSQAYKLAHRSLPEGHRIIIQFKNNWETARNRLNNRGEDVRHKTDTELLYPTIDKHRGISISQIVIES